jgi:hypothetical protein
MVRDSAFSRWQLIHGGRYYLKQYVQKSCSSPADSRGPSSRDDKVHAGQMLEL